MNQKAKIAKLIKHISTKNYSTAHKYLQSIVEDKIAKRISKAADKPLF